MRRNGVGASAEKDEAVEADLLRRGGMPVDAEEDTRSLAWEEAEVHPMQRVEHTASVRTSLPEAGEEGEMAHVACGEEADDLDAVAEEAAHGDTPADAGAGAKQEAAKAQHSRTKLSHHTVQHHAQVTYSHSTSWLYAPGAEAESVAVAATAAAEEAPVAVVAVAGLAPDSGPFPIHLNREAGVARTSSSAQEGATIPSKEGVGCPDPKPYCCLPSSASLHHGYSLTDPRCSVQPRPRFRLPVLNVQPRPPPAHMAAGRAEAAGTTPGRWPSSVYGRPFGCGSLSPGPPTHRKGW